MATKQSLVVTQPSPGVVNVQIGSQGFTFQVHELRKYWNDIRDLDLLMVQMHVVLENAGVNPNTATAAQIKTALEAQTYWW